MRAVSNEPDEPNADAPPASRPLPREYPNVISFDEVLARPGAAGATPRTETASADEVEPPSPAESGDEPRRETVEEVDQKG